MPVPTLPIRWLPVAGLLLLAGCADPNRQTFAPACPSSAILADAADLSRYRGTGRDLTDLTLSGRVIGLVGKCSRGEGDTLRTEITVQMQVGRGPAAPAGEAGRAAEVSYFVAATRGEQILDKQVFNLRVQFPPNTDQVRLAGDPVPLLLPTPKGVSGPDYRILVGFQLTPAEVAINRARAPR